EPYHTSSLTGEKWLSGMLACEAHPEWIHDQLSMHKHVFQWLIHSLQQWSGLAASKHVSAEEQVAIFLY
ncbi:hypothetical protein BS47DRAFT_1273990, partial [Hydnum rufescens UP504]